MPYKDKDKLQIKRQEYRQRLKMYVLEYLQNHPCINCGESNPAVLEFDHKNPDDKIKTISDLVRNVSFSGLTEEIKKCDVRCINCHRIRHNRSSMRFSGNLTVLNHLKTHPCVDCGESDLILLDFDHRNPEDKKGKVARLAADGVSQSRILDEIQKCDVRCAKCHRLRHFADKSVFITDTLVREMSPEAREKIRISKLGKLCSEETKTKISISLQGNHCRKINDLTGKVFGRLTVLRQGQIKPMNGGTRVYWWCQCSCGAPEKEISGIKLTTERTKSCGCLRKNFYGNQTTRKYAISDVEQRARQRFAENPNKCYQRHIREILGEVDSDDVMMSLEHAEVLEIPYEKAASLILKYEWLGTMGAGITHSFGLKIDGKLAGAVCFNRGNTPESRNICGEECANKALCLARGACIPCAPKNAASYLIRRAVKLCFQKYGYELFFAYSDFEAGEVGTIYQALGWKYLGSGDKKKYHSDFIDPTGKKWSSYKLSSWRPKLRKEFDIPEYMPVNTYLQNIGWKKVNRPLKGKYVWFEGPNRDILEKSCRYPFMPYPKRNAIDTQPNQSNSADSACGN